MFIFMFLTLATDRSCVLCQFFLLHEKSSSLGAVTQYTFTVGNWSGLSQENLPMGSTSAHDI